MQEKGQKFTFDNLVNSKCWIAASKFRLGDIQTRHILKANTSKSENFLLFAHFMYFVLCKNNQNTVTLQKI